MADKAGNPADTEFTAFANANDVQVGDTNLAAQPVTPAPKPRRGPPRTEEAPADEGNQGGAGAESDAGDENTAGEGDAGDDLDLGNLGDEGSEDEGDQGGNEGDEENRPRETAESRTKRLKRERADALRENRDLKARLARVDTAAIEERFARLENGGLPARQGADTAVSKIGAAPDPMDQTKYPLGHLDAQYIEDRTDWVADKKLAERSDADLQRQQANQQNQAQQAEQQRLANTVQDMAKKGTAIYDDFQETVVDTGMRGDWKLSKATFEAAADPENVHGARILYNLAKNPTEAAKVAAMTDIQQIRYVDKKNAEIADKIKARKIPGAVAPPTTQQRGGNSRVSISPATDNLDDFEKLVRQDAKRNSH